MTTEQNCIFCKIIQSKIPSHKVYEDEYSIAFLDIMPNNQGHTLVVPKEHYENIYVLPPETLARLSLSVQRISTAVKNAMDADGINVIMNNEVAAGQMVFHSHFHIIPRFQNDGFAHWPHTEYREGEAESVATKIKENL